MLSTILLVRLCVAVLATVVAASASAGVVGSVASTSQAVASVAGEGAAKLKLDGGDAAARSLAGVTISAVAAARKRGRTVVLPVRSLDVRRSATVAVRGGLRFRAGRRAIALRAIRLRLAAKRVTISARAGKRRLPVFTANSANRRWRLDRSARAVKLGGAKLVLTRRGARLLRAKLAVGGVRAGVIGTVGVDARPGDGTPRSGPPGAEPPRKPRSITAVDVSDISIIWYPRDSWVRYLTSGVAPGDGVSAGDGATEMPAVEQAAHPCSDVPYSGSGTFDFGHRFAAGSGWYDPATGAAVVRGRGNVRFRWKSHGIDLSASNPEIELDAGRSRAIFAFTGKGDTPYTNQRVDLVNLDLAGQPTVVGKTRTYTTVRGRLTQNGQSVFAGFYPPPNDGFGCLSVSFTTP